MRKLNSIECSEKLVAKLMSDCRKNLLPYELIFVGLGAFLIRKKKGQKKMKKMNERYTMPKIEAEKYLEPIEECIKEHDPANLKMTKLEEDEFVNRVKGMSREEMEIIADILPVELCMARIQKELDKAKRVEDYIRGTIDIL